MDFHEEHVGLGRLKEWIVTQAAKIPRQAPSPGVDRMGQQRSLLILLSVSLAAVVGNEIAENVLGDIGYLDEIVALLFANTGGQLAYASMRRLCEKKPRLTSGIWSVASGGVTLGLGLAALTAAPLISLLDGGIIALSILIPTGVKLIANSRGGRKTCPHPNCASSEDCDHRVCRSCLRIFYPAEPPDCKTKFHLDWYGVASFLDLQKLNYIEAMNFVMKDWELPISKSGLVDCESFVPWMRKNRGRLSAYVDSVHRSDHTDAILDTLGV